MRYNCITILICLTLFVSCKKFVEVPPPPNAVTIDKVFVDDNKAISTLNGVYGYMINAGPVFSNQLGSIYPGLASDELIKYNPLLLEDVEFMNNQVQTGNGWNLLIWQSAYKIIFYANSILEGVTRSSGLSESGKKIVAGEALFLRAFSHFYLVNLYGDVPLVTTSDYKENATRPRTPTDDVYAQIIADLKEAKRLLPETYPVPGKVRPNRWAAVALLARAYQYTHDWENAETEASAVIGSRLYTPLENIPEVFKKNSREALWQLAQTASRTPEFSSHYRPFGSPNTYLRSSCMDWFEGGDLRRTLWIDSITVGVEKYYYPGKYKTTTNTYSYMVLRAGELFLIRAEARAHLDRLELAIEDLNVIRTRSGLFPLALDLNKETVLYAVQQERRIELMAEWGTRWFDLKRYGTIDAAMLAAKGSQWQPTDALFPIPATELIANIALIQNPGY